MTANEDEHMEFEGVVQNSVKGIISVQLETGSTVQCHIGGKMRQNKIQIVVGDSVRVKISPYDLGKGIITYRL